MDVDSCADGDDSVSKASVLTPALLAVLEPKNVISQITLINGEKILVLEDDADSQQQSNNENAVHREPPDLHHLQRDDQSADLAPRPRKQ